MEGLLPEMDAVVIEAKDLHLPSVTTDESILLRYAYDPHDIRPRREALGGHELGLADEVDLDE